MTPQPRSGYTLPVFACASAIASLHHLHNHTATTVTLHLVEPDDTAEIPIEQVARVSPTQALGVTRSDPGDNLLDLTRNTPVWAMVEQVENASEAITIQGGEGIGMITETGTSAIYRYAQRLMLANLQPLLKPNEKIKVTIILPEGKALAQRTSNEAFGVVEGLSLLGTTGISQPLTAPGQLAEFHIELVQKSQEYDTLVFCLGENGLDLARKIGINPNRLIKTANWLGSLLVAASEAGVNNILLFGYHGKLIKLAGGIFHTHHHLADGRLEILTAYGAKIGLPTPQLQTLLTCPTTEAALQQLRQWDTEKGTNWVEEIYSAIASAIDTRSQSYITKHSNHSVSVGSVLFGRDREIIIQSSKGTALMSQLC